MFGCRGAYKENKSQQSQYPGHVVFFFSAAGTHLRLRLRSLAHLHSIRTGRTSRGIEGVIVAAAGSRRLCWPLPLDAVGRGWSASGRGALGGMNIPRRLGERRPLRIFLGFKQKGHR